MNRRLFLKRTELHKNLVNLIVTLIVYMLNGRVSQSKKSASRRANMY